MRTAPTTGLLLAALLGACQPGVAPHPASRADQLAIEGAVTGAVLAGVTIRAEGAASLATTTDATGRFRLASLPRGQYLLTATAGGAQAFTPASRVVTLLDRDVLGQDFAAVASSALEGTLAGSGSARATLTVSGPVTRVVGSDGAGFYRVTDLPAGRYAVQPADPGTVFTPASAVVTLTGGEVVTQDFATRASGGATHALSGAVAGPAPAGVRLVLGGANTGATQTDADGRYAFTGLADGSYSVTAQPVTGYLYRARARLAVVAGADVAGLDFSEYAPAAARFAYVVAQPPPGGPSAVFQFAVGAGGALSPLAAPTVATGGDGPAAADPAGRALYVPSFGANAIAQYAIGADGQLTPMATPTVPCSGGPRLVAVDPGGAWAWVLGQSSADVRTFSIDAGGALSAAAVPGVPVGAASGLAVHPSGQHVYVVSGASVLQFDVGAGGALTAMATPSVGLPAEDAGAFASRLAVDPSGRFAYLTANHPTRFQSWVVPYAVGADGALTALGPQAYAPPYQFISYGSVELLAEPSGRFLYVAPAGVPLQFPSHALTQYALGADGLPELGAQNIFAGFAPAHLAVDPGGAVLYAASVANLFDQLPAQATLTWFTVEPTGNLTPQGSVITGLFAQSVTLVAR